MSDRDKVISHFQDAIEASGAENYWRFVRVDMLEDAIALLREQEPVKPIKKLGIVEAFKCGACKWVLGWTTEFPLYCPRCGRGIKWDD